MPLLRALPLALLVAALPLTPATAEDSPSPEEAVGRLMDLPGRTALEKVASAYAAGTLPSNKQLRGYRAGRAFRSISPNFPHPAFLRGEPNANRGPMFPERAVAWYLPVAGGEAPITPRFFDDPGDAAVAVIEAAHGKDFGPGRRGDNCLEYDLRDAVGNLAQVFQFRYFEGLVIARIKAADADAPGWYAYFFLRRPDPLLPPESMGEPPVQPPESAS